MGPFQAFLLSSMETTERPVLVIGIDDNSHSFYALQWTLDHFFSPPKPSLSNSSSFTLARRCLSLSGSSDPVKLSSFLCLVLGKIMEPNKTLDGNGSIFLSNQTEKMSQA
ncbi:hypothetical protein CK203_062646 [Vitis vinifera]|uniref:Uncharacterized protein n=1 Tax=Vitis vinifera TaxID=29760 RepID=A0A438GBT9_VITVI|nr:hypothetical protein CK203_062646 [Vitis vinifera]